MFDIDKNMQLFLLVINTNYNLTQFNNNNI